MNTKSETPAEFDNFERHARTDGREKMPYSDGDGDDFEAVPTKITSPGLTPRTFKIYFPTSWYPECTFSDEECVEMEARISAWLHKVGVFDNSANDGIDSLDTSSSSTVMHRKMAAFNIRGMGGPSKLIVGQNRKGAELVHKFVVAFCLLDDVIEDTAVDGRAMIEEVRTFLNDDVDIVATTEDVKNNPIMYVWFDFIQSVREQEPDRGGKDNNHGEFFARFKTALHKFLDALSVELDYDHGLVQISTEKDLEEFRNVRYTSVGIGVTSVLMGIAASSSSSSFPTRLFDQPELQKIIELSSFMNRWSNELLSLPKDIHDGCQNLILVTMNMNKWKLEETIDHILALRIRAIHQVDALREQLLLQQQLTDDDDDGNLEERMTRTEETKNYLTALCNHLVGADFWFVNSVRYTKWTLVHRSSATPEKSEQEGGGGEKFFKFVVVSKEEEEQVVSKEEEEQVSLTAA